MNQESLFIGVFCPGFKAGSASTTEVAKNNEPAAFRTPEEQKVAQITFDVIRKMENQPQRLPCVSYLNHPNIQEQVMRDVEAQYHPSQLELERMTTQPVIAGVVAKTAELVIQQTIDILRLRTLPLPGTEVSGRRRAHSRCHS